ncbi:metal-dependent transcriptional regulator [uncultured Bifidobacterium sp.]|uniref:metal-dependent transcriptional regulator n=1 Tax=uncultured Bifidobacterium sp. TaxID=165187 RepID=UPI0028DD1098|nr:metal-dependent transcriptional regulator [uncultured Bifidobacterium sp.]
MPLHELSPNAQDYLKVIWDLREWDGASVQSSDLARRVHVKLSTVSGAVNRLVTGGFATHNPYGAIELTPEGERYALAMVRRHRLLETFLVRSLDYGWDEVHTEADSLEHAASDLMIDRIDTLLGHPDTDPHGDPIPRADGTLPESDSIPLADAPDGACIRIDRVSDEDPHLLRFLEEQGVGIGSQARVEARRPFSGVTTIHSLHRDSEKTSSSPETTVSQQTSERPPMTRSISVSDAAAKQIRVSILDAGVRSSMAEPSATR